MDKRITAKTPKEKLSAYLLIQQQIISACLFNTYLIDFVSEIIKPEHFCKEHAIVYEAIIDEYYNSGLKEYPEITVKLLSKGINPNPYMELSGSSLLSVQSIKNKILLMLDLHLSFTTDKILSKSVEDNKTSIQGLDTLEDLKCEIDNLINLKNSIRTDKPLSDEISSFIEDLEKERKSNKSPILSHDFNSFNVTGGLKEGNLVSICGAFKQGKTSFALQLLLDFAYNSKIPCGIISLEMSKKELVNKILSSKCDVSYGHLRNPKQLSDDELNLLSSKGAGYLNKTKLFINDETGLTENRIASIIRKWKRIHNVKVVLIDYIGLIRSSKISKNSEIARDRELSYISSFLKNLALELDVVIISLAQLNRQGLKSPSIENVAESISIARDSDFVFIISNPASASNEKSIVIDGNKYDISNNTYVVKLDASRHSPAGKKFILELTPSGEFKEKEYDEIGEVSLAF